MRRSCQLRIRTYSTCPARLHSLTVVSGSRKRKNYESLPVRPRAVPWHGDAWGRSVSIRRASGEHWRVTRHAAAIWTCSEHCHNSRHSAPRARRPSLFVRDPVTSARSRPTDRPRTAVITSCLFSSQLATSTNQSVKTGHRRRRRRRLDRGRYADHGCLSIPAKIK